MLSDLEAVAADTAAGLARPGARHALPLGSPCPNCATKLEGPWCHACGQKADDYHRSIWKLGAESIEGFFELDGRLFRTVPRLIFAPGKLTCDYLNGKRQPQIPPFRLFLVVVLILFFAGGAGMKKALVDTPDGAKAGYVVDNEISASDSKRVQKAKAAGQQARDEVKADLEREGIKVEGGPVQINTGGGSSLSDDPFGRWIEQRARAINDNKEAFADSIETWGHRLAILALPMSAAILGLLYVFRRKFYIFDHLIFSMHSLSFLGLLVSAIILLSKFAPGPPWPLLLFAAPVHLFMHMRKVYERGVITTLLRMFVLFIASVFGATLIILMVFFLGLNDMGVHAKDVPPPTPPTKEEAAAQQEEVRKAVKAGLDKAGVKPPPKPKKPEKPAEAKSSN